MRTLSFSLTLLCLSSPAVLAQSVAPAPKTELAPASAVVALHNTAAAKTDTHASSQGERVVQYCVPGSALVREMRLPAGGTLPAPAIEKTRRTGTCLTPR